MKLRTFLVMLAVLALLGVVFSVALDRHNLDLLVNREFHLWRGTAVSVGWTVLWAFVGGFGLALVLGLSREAGLLVDRWRQRRASRKSEEIDEEYTRGLIAVLEGREDEALRHFRAVLERDSRHFNTLIKIGEVLRSRERFADAIEYHRKAHHLKEDDTRPLYALVEDHEAQGEMERARNVLGRIIAINKASIAAWRKLRSLHMKERSWEKALEAHRQVEKLANPGDPKDTVDRRIGTGIEYEQARARFEAGDTKDAIGMLKRLAKAHPEFVPAHVTLGRALVRTGRESDGVRVWRDGFRGTGSPVFLSVLEDHFLEREEPMSAIDGLKECMVTHPDTVRFHLGKLYFRLEMLDDAQAMLSSLEGRASRAPALHFLLGRIHERRGNTRQAADYYRRVIKERDFVGLDFRCRSCGAHATEWSGRCGECGAWNTIEPDPSEEVSFEEPGLAPAPIYTART